MEWALYPAVVAPRNWEAEWNQGRAENLHRKDLLSVVRFTHKKMAKHGEMPVLTEQEAVEALRQYYALPILEYPRQQFTISSVVDEYWHWHLLDTRGWRDFCNRVYGCMMHHVPLDPDNHVDFTRVRSLYKETRRLLVKHFGTNVNERAYPFIGGERRDIVICSYDYCISQDLFDWTLSWCDQYGRPFFNFMKNVLFKVKSKKQNIWRSWCAYLIAHQQEAEETMREENCVYERSIMYEREGEFYVVGTSAFKGDFKPANLSIELNIKHHEAKVECLGKAIAVFEGQFHLPFVYEILYEFDLREW